MGGEPRTRAYGARNVMPVMVPVDVAAMIHEARALEHERTLRDAIEAVTRVRTAGRDNSSASYTTDRALEALRNDHLAALRALEAGGSS